MREMGFGDDYATQINSDNQSAQCLAKDSQFHARSKHIDIKYHHVREMVKNKFVEINYVPTENMIADILTKNLCKVKHMKFTCMLGMQKIKKFV